MRSCFEFEKVEKKQREKKRCFFVVCKSACQSINRRTRFAMLLRLNYWNIFLDCSAALTYKFDGKIIVLKLMSDREQVSPAKEKEDVRWNQFSAEYYSG